MAVHVVKKPNPSVKPQVIDIMDRSVSLETLLLFSRISLTARREDMVGNVRIQEVKSVPGQPAVIERTMREGLSRVLNYSKHFFWGKR